MEYLSLFLFGIVVKAIRYFLFKDYGFSASPKLSFCTISIEKQMQCIFELEFETPMLIQSGNSLLLPPSGCMHLSYESQEIAYTLFPLQAILQRLWKFCVILEFVCLLHRRSRNTIAELDSSSAIARGRNRSAMSTWLALVCWLEP